MGTKYDKKPRRQGECVLLAVFLLAVATLCAAAAYLLAAQAGPLQKHASGVREPRLRASATTDAAAQRLGAAAVDAHELDVADVLHDIGGAAFEVAVGGEARTAASTAFVGRRVVVLDGAIPEAERRRVADRYIKLTGADAQQGWHREKANDNSLDHNAMAKDLSYDECNGQTLDTLRTLAPQFYEECAFDRPIWVSRCSIYAQTFIDVDEAHQDRSHDAVGFSVTAIWYPHERWHAHWGGETVFLSGKDSATAELLLPVLPKPGRLLLFDSELTHMAKPSTAIAEPFAPPLFRGALASTRTTGNRFAVVERLRCGLETVAYLIERLDGDGDGSLSRVEYAALLKYLDIPDAAGAIAYARRRTQRGPPYSVQDVRTIFGIVDAK